MATLTTLESVIAVVADASSAAPRELTTIGIVGQPGSGKTTVAMDLVDALGDHAQLLSMDGFHFAQSRLVELGRRDRMGAPDTFDVAGFIAVLTRLRRDSGVVRAPGFDRSTEEPVADAVAIPPDTSVVIIEGNYLLHDDDGWDAVAPLLDLCLYLDVDQETRLERLIARHARFGKSPDAARAWALGPDEANARMISAARDRADHVIRL